MIARPNGSTLITWAVSAAIAAGSGLLATGVRVGGYEQRIAEAERLTVRLQVEQEQLRRDTVEQLRRIEVSLAELRAEQRILHGR